MATAAKTSVPLVFLRLLLFLALIDVTLSLQEWKKFENGIVQSENHEAVHSKQNKTDDYEEETTSTSTKQQRILHNHHGEKLNHHKKNKDQQPESKDTQDKLPEDQLQTPRPNKDRHHRKNAEKILHAGHRGEAKKQPKPPTANEAGNDDEQDQEIMKDINKDNDDKPKKKNSSKWGEKPEGMSTMQWRRLQKEEERRKLEKAKIIAESWLNKTDYLSQKTKKKKHVIRKMEGNKMAKKLWKEAFRGPDRLVLK